MRELEPLVGGRIEKIYHPTLDHLVLSVRRQGESKSYIHFVVGKWIYLTSSGQEGGKQPSDFAMMLRKRLTNATISSVRQQGFDRIVVLSLEKDGQWDLVLELFAEGNIILVKDGTIVQPLTSHTWKHRDVRARREFMFPPPVPDPFKLSSEELLGPLSSSDTDLIRTLATRLNTGGKYGEEICARSGLDCRMRAAELKIDDVRRIVEAARGIKDDIISNPGGVIVRKGAEIEDVVPIRLRIYETFDVEQFESFSKAIESYISRAPKPKLERPKDGTQDTQRLQRKLLQQESAVTKLQDEARLEQSLGDYLFEKYGIVSGILASARQVPPEADPVKVIGGAVSFDRRNSVLKVRIDGVLVDLDVKGSVESNAKAHYEESKKSRKKLEGLLEALEETRREIGADAKGHAEAGPEERPKHEGTKRFWFERFRWFVSSEGAVVLGGKDAKSNDMLVKKHLQAGDRYVHADVHGAPSLVVKMKEGVTEKTLHEACEFAVAMSKAWNAKIGSGVGYWVLPEQVSKTPESGEYLAKGAFVIRGKRNYSEKLEIKLGIGEIQFEGHRKIMCGPVDSVRANASRYMVIRPGGRDKNSFAKDLAKAFEVPIEEIQSILPPGDVEVVEQSGSIIS